MDAFCSPKAKPGSALQAANNAKPQDLTAPAAKAPATAQKTQQNAIAATPAVKPPAPPKTKSEKAPPAEAPPKNEAKTQKKKVAQGTWSSSVRRQLEKADARAATALEADDITTEAVERVLAGIGEWPTQARPNVSPDAKAVTGMCLGAVNVLGGVGMQLSAVSQNFQNLVKLVCAWTAKELPDFPFSSLQINYNYAVARGVPRRLPLSPRGDGVEMERRRGDGVERSIARAGQETCRRQQHRALAHHQPRGPRGRRALGRGHVRRERERQGREGPARRRRRERHQLCGNQPVRRVHPTILH